VKKTEHVSPKRRLSFNGIHGVVSQLDSSIFLVYGNFYFTRRMLYCFNISQTLHYVFIPCILCAANIHIYPSRVWFGRLALPRAPLMTKRHCTVQGIVFGCLRYKQAVRRVRSMPILTIHITTFLINVLFTIIHEFVNNFVVNSCFCLEWRLLGCYAVWLL
jgi:hypothetical protein